MKILYIEDDKMLAKATMLGLSDIFSVDWFDSAEDSLLALSSVKYDLIICDINLPGMTGLDFSSKLRQAKNFTPILFLTARDTLENKIEGFDSGGDDYLIKPFDLKELIARCNALFRRSTGCLDLVIKHKNIEYNTTKKTILLDSNPINLSAKELSIFDLLINNIGIVKSRSDIENHLYSTWSDDSIESNAIEVHISSIRKKLGKDLIKNIRNLGYIIT